MNPRLLNLLSGNKDIYPNLLEEKFPRVFTKLLDLWETPHIDAFLKDLMMDNRTGTREGFPPEAAVEIFRLSNYLHELRNAGKEVQAWDDIPEYKRFEAEGYGYEKTAQGFMKAVDDNNRDAMQAFISGGFDLESHDDRNWTPLMVAAFNGNEVFAKLLLKCGAKLTVNDKNGYSPLHWSAYNGHVEVVKLLIEQGADPNTQSLFGWTPLMQAATRGQLLVCAYLIFRGANVNLASSDGWTSLHKAANNGHAEVVKLLLAKGANRLAKYGEGILPIDLAIKAGHLDIVALLNQITIPGIHPDAEPNEDPNSPDPRIHK